MPHRPVSATLVTSVAEMPEDRGPESLDAHVRKLMKDMDLWGFHVRNSIGSERGWVDWVILGPGGALFRELKSERGILSRDQRLVGYRLQAAGLDWAIWRPRDLISEVIAHQLWCISRNARAT